MKIVFLSTGRGLRPGFVNELREKLGLDDADLVGMVSWHQARAPLPVYRHLVLGPNLRVTGKLATSQRVQRRLDPLTADVGEVSAAEDATPANPTAQPALNPTSAANPASAANPDSPTEVPAQAEATTSLAEATAAAEVAEAKAMLPVFHPRRMRKAVTWRIRRAKVAAATAASPRLTAVRTNPLFRKVRNRLGPSVSLGFATSVLRAGPVHDMARDADLVIALDAASQRGAWMLAQKVAGPDIIIGIPAAKQRLEERAEPPAQT